MNDDDLREKLTEALEGVIFPTEGSITILGSDYTPTSEGIDALMPVIREALADCHDNAVQAAGEHAMGGPMPDNPWREQP